MLGKPLPCVIGCPVGPGGQIHNLIAATIEVLEGLGGLAILRNVYDRTATVSSWNIMRLRKFKFGQRAVYVSDNEFRMFVDDECSKVGAATIADYIELKHG